MAKLDKEQQEVIDELTEAFYWIQEAKNTLNFESFQGMQHVQRNLILAARNSLTAAAKLYTHMRLKGG